jgi:hypothetical protein
VTVHTEPEPLQETAAERAARIRRRIVRIELVLGALAVIAVVIVIAVGVLGIGNFAGRSLGR